MIVLLVLGYFAPDVEAKVISRMHSVDLKQIAKLKQEIAKDKAETVVFVGDSVVYSSSARYDKDTIPSYFASMLENKGLGRNIHVYDLSLSGSSFTDTYEILKYVMPARPDYIIYDLNVVWFAAKGRSYASLLDLRDPVAIEKHKPTKLTFGEHCYTRWDKKTWSQLEGFPVKLGDYDYSERNEQWQAYLRIASLFKTYPDTRVIMFLPPRNHALYSRYEMVDQALFLEKRDMVTSYLPSNVVCPDYTWKVGNHCFADIIHQLPEGNKQTAELLVQDFLKVRKK